MPTVGELLALPKSVVLPAKPKAKANQAHREIDLEVQASGAPGHFLVYVRVNVHLAESFSIGLRYHAVGKEASQLLRLNGDHGGHQNPDGSRLEEGPHLHAPTPDEASQEPAQHFEPRMATPVVAAQAISLPDAWLFFCQAAKIGNPASAADVLKQMQGLQLALDGVL